MLKYISCESGFYNAYFCSRLSLFWPPKLHVEFIWKYVSENTSAWYAEYQPLVSLVPQCGIRSTTVWYMPYQRVVWQVPTRGMTNTKGGNGRWGEEFSPLSPVVYISSAVPLCFLFRLFLLFVQCSYPKMYRVSENGHSSFCLNACFQWFMFLARIWQV